MSVRCLSSYFSLISFTNVFYFSVHGSLTSLLKIIPKYFSLFYAIVNVIFYLILFSDCSLMVYRNTVGFCISVVYPTTLLNLFILIFQDYLGFSVWEIMPSANRISFIPSFLSKCLLYLFLA